jgi:hypothetical protein
MPVSLSGKAMVPRNPETAVHEKQALQNQDDTLWPVHVGVLKCLIQITIRREDSQQCFKGLPGTVFVV